MFLAPDLAIESCLAGAASDDPKEPTAQGSHRSSRWSVVKTSVAASQAPITITNYKWQSSGATSRETTAVQAVGLEVDERVAAA